MWNFDVTVRDDSGTIWIVLVKSWISAWFFFVFPLFSEFSPISLCFSYRFPQKNITDDITTAFFWTAIRVQERGESRSVWIVLVKSRNLGDRQQPTTTNNTTSPAPTTTTDDFQLLLLIMIIPLNWLWFVNYGSETTRRRMSTGLRIDHILISPALVPQCQASYIDRSSRNHGS